MPPTKPRLCLITTGGTIGMVADADGTLRPAEEATDYLTAVPELGDRYDLRVVPLMNRDSSEFGPADWTRIVAAVAEAFSTCDGVVVTHGTDTLEYTAAAVAISLGRSPTPCPVVLTGAMRSADHPQPDGPRNLADACRVAAAGIAQVMVTVAGTMFSAVDLTKADPESLDAFRSVLAPPLGTIADDALRGEGFRPTIESNDDFISGHRFDPGVVPITLRPGLSPALFMPMLDDPDARAFLLEGFGAGNVPTEGQGSWVEFIRQATQRDKPVVLQRPMASRASTASMYAGGRAAIEAGAIPAGPVTSAVAFVKLSYALAYADRVGSQVQAATDIMARNLADELDSPGL